MEGICYCIIGCFVYSVDKVSSTDHWVRSRSWKEGEIHGDEILQQGDKTICGLETKRMGTVIISSILTWLLYFQMTQNYK